LRIPSSEMALEAGDRVIVSGLPKKEAKYNNKTGVIVWGKKAEASASLVVDGKVSGSGFRFRG
jgi:hypothetical protein